MVTFVTFNYQKTENPSNNQPNQSLNIKIGDKKFGFYKYNDETLKRDDDEGVSNQNQNQTVVPSNEIPQQIPERTNIVSKKC